MKYKKPTFFEWETNKPSILFQIHKQLSKDLTGNLVQTTSTATPAFASVNQKSMTAVLTAGDEEKARPVTIKAEGRQKYSKCTIWRINGTEFDYQIKQEELPVKNGSVTLNLQPLDVAIAVFK
jgi:hypothetical protein